MDEEKDVKKEDIEKLDETKPEKVEESKEDKEVKTVVVEEKTTTQSKQEQKGLCIAAMVLGIIAVVLWCVWFISIPCTILAVVFGIIGLKKPGKGMAIAGLVLGIISVCIWSIVLLFGIGIMAGGLAEAFDELDSDYSYDYNYYDRYDYR